MRVVWLVLSCAPVLAGGCFWGMQDLIRRMDGVIATRVGYAGGDVPNATYRNHGTHAEGIEILFDPAKMSFRRLLEFFFQIHDPTTLNRQGNDRGTGYRSGIYYVSPEQKQVAEEVKQGVRGAVDEVGEHLASQTKSAAFVMDCAQGRHNAAWDATSKGFRARVSRKDFDALLAKHGLGREVKAITYHELKVEPTPAGWLAEVIVDI